MRPMIKLLARNRGVGSFRAVAGEDSDTIYLYDMIVDSDEEAEFFGGISPQNFLRELHGLKSQTVHLRINSPGGDVFAARAIEQGLREHKAKIIAHVDGYAASAATFPLMAADEVVIAPGAFIMIHKAWGGVVGNSDEIRQMAGLLDQIDLSLAKSYATKTGQGIEEITAWMAAETWLDAEKAVSLGFADSVASDGAKALAWDLSVFANAPDRVSASGKDEEPESNTSEQVIEHDPRDELLRALDLRKRI